MELLCANSIFNGEINDKLYKKNVKFSARVNEF